MELSSLPSSTPPSQRVIVRERWGVGLPLTDKYSIDLNHLRKASKRVEMRGTHDKGMIQVYTGEGKGKTTAALGLALRAVGQGFKVVVVQFLKSRDTGERRAAERLAPELTWRIFGAPGFPKLKSPSPEVLALIREGWEYAKAAILSGEYRVVILDEINLVLAYGHLTWEEVRQVLEQRPPWVEVVFTGRQAPPELLAAADLITEVRAVKHYYEAGVPARRGIEW